MIQKAFIFPGQGSQIVGMGKDLYEKYQKVRLLYNQAEEILDFPVREISFEGPEDLLKQTKHTQPCLFVHSLAVNIMLKEKGFQPQAVAGHSLGEYSALAAAAALSLEDGLKLVKLRGELMQYAGEKNPGTMAAVIGLSAEQVEEICAKASEDGIVNAANFNSPGQIVISGNVDNVHRAMEMAKSEKARLVTELPVSGAFHSHLMADALQGLTRALDTTEIKEPVCPVYTNVEAQPARNPQKLRESLKMQLLSPVLWQSIIENMIKNGIQKFYEVGASRVLTGLNRRITKESTCTSVGSVQDLEMLDEENS